MPHTRKLPRMPHTRKLPMSIIMPHTRRLPEEDNYATHAQTPEEHNYAAHAQTTRGGSGVGGAGGRLRGRGGLGLVDLCKKYSSFNCHYNHCAIRAISVII